MDPWFVEIRSAASLGESGDEGQMPICLPTSEARTTSFAVVANANRKQGIFLEIKLLPACTSLKFHGTCCHMLSPLIGALTIAAFLSPTELRLVEYGPVWAKQGATPRLKPA
mgnify:CR=1 FL=1